MTVTAQRDGHYRTSRFSVLAATIDLLEDYFMRNQPGNFPGSGFAGGCGSGGVGDASSDDIRKAQATVQSDATQMCKPAIPACDAPIHHFFQSGSMVSVKGATHGVWDGLGVVEPYSMGCGTTMVNVLMVTGKMKGQKGYFFAASLELLHGMASIHNRQRYVVPAEQTPSCYGF